jgi:uncharacterized protein DUF4831
MSKHLYFLSVMSALAFSGCAKIVVVKVEKPPVAAEGVIYALPRTVVRVQLKVDRTERKGAPFVAYAPIFAPDAKPICKAKDCKGEEVSFSIQKGATFGTYGEPDGNNVFLVKFTNGRTLDQTLSMTWNEVGLLSASSASVTNRTTDVVLSGLKLAAGLGTKAAGVGAPGAKEKAKSCSELDPATQDSKADMWFIDELTPDNPYALNAYCSMDPGDREKLPQNGPLLSRAASAYVSRIVPLLTARETILRAANGSFAEPAAILPRIETEIANREAALYLGSQNTTTWDGSLDVRNLSLGTVTPILKVASDGICPQNADLPPDGKPVPDKFNSPSKCATAKTVNLILNLYPAKGQMFTQMSDVTKGERGFRYRIPAQVKANLDDDAGSDEHQVYGGGIFSVAQFGTIISLPAKRTSKTISYDLTFMEATGALKTFKLGTTGGLDSATVDALAGVGGTALDARNKARQNEDQLTVLTREDSILKLKDDICTIQKKYNLPCAVQPQ